MTRLFIPVGPPGCGKTTLAGLAVDAGLLPDVGVVSPDHYRAVLTGNRADQSANVTVFEIVENIVEHRLTRWLDTWVDATNLGSSVDRWKAVAAAAHIGPTLNPDPDAVEVVVIVFDVPLPTLLDRNERRAHPVPVDVIRRMHDAMDRPHPMVVARSAVTADDFYRLVKYGGPSPAEQWCQRTARHAPHDWTAADLADGPVSRRCLGYE
jgi:predicted kinase